jgi:NADH-quinone oxidoreductase subunit M
MGGLWEQMPALGSMGLIFSMASLGLPGLGNFVAEFLTLLGTFKSSVLFASVASLGLIAATIYSLRIVQKVFFGRKSSDKPLKDINIRESIVLASLVIAILFTGLYPGPVITTVKPSINKTISAKEKSFNSAIAVKKKALNVVSQATVIINGNK